MENILTLINSKNKSKSLIIDFFALTFIYFVPAISHMFNFPIYLIEPMRIMLILSIAHTTKRNAYLIALTLPLFSFLISSHPSVIKTTIISIELLANVWLFFALSKRISQKFISIFLSIIISKIFYYVLKFALINFALLNTELISTPLKLQFLMAWIFSTYIFLADKINSSSSS